MTGREFSEVDVDLLADYVCGALDGTPDEAVVAALVSDDPGWRSAHDALVPGMALVSDRLRDLGPVCMPDEVAARLAAAFSALPAAPRAASLDAGSDAGAASADRPPGVQAAELPAEKRRLSIVGGAQAAPTPPSGNARQRRLRRWAVPLTAAAGVAAFAGAGIAYLADGPENMTAESSADSAAPANAPFMAPEGAEADRLPAPAAGAVLPSDQQITTTGAEYERASLREQAATSRQAAAVTAKDLTHTAVPMLQRLLDRGALAVCLDAIARQNDAGQITVDSVDYARFEGNPALIVRFTAANGTWAWVAGPDCGAPGGDSDTVYQLPVG